MTKFCLTNAKNVSSDLNVMLSCRVMLEAAEKFQNKIALVIQWRRSLIFDGGLKCNIFNSIPDHVKREETVAGFKTKLKTFLYKKHLVD
jgi:hypothetical protein